MTTRFHRFVESEHYHVYNRGNGKMQIFHDNEDKEKFLKLLEFANIDKRIRIRDKIKTKTPRVALGKNDKLVFIGAYTLMPNHFHILLKQNKPDGIAKFMLKVGTGYAMYYNKKYNRSGALFEGKFKSKMVLGDVYLKYLFSYIHLNPLKIIDKDWKENRNLNNQKFLDFLNKYHYSSYLDFLKPGFWLEQKILSKSEFPDYFQSKEVFEREIFDWIVKGSN